jgi:hypothetical protein
MEINNELYKKLYKRTYFICKNRSKEFREDVLHNVIVRFLKLKPELKTASLYSYLCAAIHNEYIYFSKKDYVKKGSLSDLGYEFDDFYLNYNFIYDNLDKLTKSEQNVIKIYLDLNSSLLLSGMARDSGMNENTFKTNYRLALMKLKGIYNETNKTINGSNCVNTVCD